VVRWVAILGFRPDWGLLVGRLLALRFFVAIIHQIYRLLRPREAFNWSVSIFLIRFRVINCVSSEEKLN
jgi:hypothetical protein